MKLKLLLTTILGSIAISGAQAGDCYCPPSVGKCPVECSPDHNGEITVGYHSDYILYGVRHFRDNVRADVNYTFDCLPLPLTVGFTQISGLGSVGFDRHDESDVYASVQLPGFLGFSSSAGYIHRFYPTLRGPTGTLTNNGDSRGEIWVKLERELICGVNAFYRRAYDLNMPSGLSTQTGNTQDGGAFAHTLGLEKDFCISDCVGLSLSGGVLYTDNYWPTGTTAAAGNPRDRNRSSGWNSYYIKAALPIALSCNATLTPYIGYNGTPDTWIADGVILNANDVGGTNDILHGGVSLSVKF